MRRCAKEIDEPTTWCRVVPVKALRTFWHPANARISRSTRRRGPQSCTGPRHDVRPRARPLRRAEDAAKACRGAPTPSTPRRPRGPSGGRGLPRSSSPTTSKASTVTTPSLTERRRQRVPSVRCRPPKPRTSHWRSSKEGKFAAKRAPPIALRKHRGLAISRRALTRSA